MKERIHQSIPLNLGIGDVSAREAIKKAKGVARVQSFGQLPKIGDEKRKPITGPSIANSVSTNNLKARELGFGQDNSLIQGKQYPFQQPKMSLDPNQHPPMSGSLQQMGAINRKQFASRNQSLPNT